MLIKRVKNTNLIDSFKSLKNKNLKEKEKIYLSLIKQLSWIPCSLSAKYRKFDNYQDILQIGP